MMPAKQTLFRTALIVGMIGSVLVSSILFLQGGIALGDLQYTIDIGHHSLRITSGLLIFFGLLSFLTFVLLAIGLIQVNRTYALTAAGILAACSLGLILLGIWSFWSLTGDRLSVSINDYLVKEIDQTQFSIGSGNVILIENTHKLAQLERQHRCCGINDPVDDYRTRQTSSLISIPTSTNTVNTNSKGSRTTTTTTTTTASQKNAHASSIPLPISCCNDNYRSIDNLCIDMFVNNTHGLHRYQTNGCHTIILRDKSQRIQQQGTTIVVAACLAVISCIALAAVTRLLNESYQVTPLPRTT
jgi:hypothetical protein